MKAQPHLARATRKAPSLPTGYKDTLPRREGPKRCLVQWFVLWARNVSAHGSSALQAQPLFPSPDSVHAAGTWSSVKGHESLAVSIPNCINLPPPAHPLVHLHVRTYASGGRSPPTFRPHTGALVLGCQAALVWNSLAINGVEQHPTSSNHQAALKRRTGRRGGPVLHPCL